MGGMVDCTSMSEPCKSLCFFKNILSRMKVGCFFDIPTHMKVVCFVNNNKGSIEGTNSLCMMFVHVHLSFMFVFGLLL